jgi:WhiB family redox-sensing transcriptional regulator
VTVTLAVIVVWHERPAWFDDAACRGSAPGLFYPGPGDTRVAAEACAVCRQCPVQGECLNYALKNNEEHGIWGGANGRERRRMRMGVR